MFMMDVIFWLLVLFYVFNVQTSRQPRTVVYPPGAGNKIQFIVGIGIPASDLPALQSVTWGYVIKTNYVLPTNVSYYGDPPIETGRSSSGISRWDFYNSMEDVLNRYGMPGKDCMLRTICETSEINFTTKSVIGEFLNIFLLPSSTNDRISEYYAAELMGRRKMGQCSSYACPISLLDLISVVKNVTKNDYFIPPM